MTACPHCGSAVESLDIEFIFASGEVRAGGTTAKLRPMHLRILECLIDAYPQALAKTALFAELYGDKDEPPSYNTLQTALGQMRAMMTAANLPIRVITVSAGADTDALLLVAEHRQSFIKQVA